QYCQYDQQLLQTPLYRDVLAAAATPPLSDAPRLRDRLMAASGTERQAQLQAYPVHQLAAVLHLPPAHVALHTPLQDLGIDSLMMLELRNRLATGLGLEIAPAHLVPGSTVARLSASLLATLPLASSPGSEVLPDEPDGASASDQTLPPDPLAH